MSCLSISSSIIPTDQWIPQRPLLRLPLIGSVEIEDVHRFISRLGFILLLAAAGVLLVHPLDVVPGFEDLSIYQALIACCLAASFPRVVVQLSFESLRANAITCLILLLVAAAGTSHLNHGTFYDARQSIAVVGKVALLYLLVLGLLSSPARLRMMLAAMAAFILGMTVLAVLQYHGFVNLQGIQHVERHATDSATDEMTVVVRLCGIGLFNDPNDLSIVIVLSIALCGYFLNGRLTKPLTQALLLSAIMFLFYALYLTHSRGGAVAAVASLVVFVGARFGKGNALALVCLLLPILIVATRGGPDRVNLDNPEDTFQSRLELWSESFDALRSAPLMGIGRERLEEEIGQVAHNSYLQAFTEMGLLGGIAFVGIFYLVLRGIWKAEPIDPDMARLRPYMLAMTTAYAAGLLSLSRCYQPCTLLVIAVATAYLTVASRRGPVVLPRMDGRCVRHITWIGVFFLAGTYVFIRLMLQRSAS